VLAVSAIAAGLVALRLAAPASGQTPRPAAVASSELANSTLVERGAYLAKLGDCEACHTATKNSPAFAGGLGMNSPFGTIYSANITPDPQTGIGKYSYADFERALRDGVAPGGKHLYPAMPYPSFAKMTDSDVRALYAYFMHGVQAVHNQPPLTTLPFPFSQRWGLFVWNAAFVHRNRFEPDSAHDEQWTRGAYLTQSLGHCGACHTPRGPAYE
jgi:mono/diheme cytochrome c family protein